MPKGSYRGDIPPNTTATIRFLADFSSSGTAILMAGSAAFGGTPTTKSAVVAPGGSGTLDIPVPKDGIVKVDVDFRADDDSGRLDVSTTNGFKDGDSVVGDQSWTYSIVA